jgi:hypothetical protein
MIIMTSLKKTHVFLFASAGQKEERREEVGREGGRME